MYSDVIKNATDYLADADMSTKQYTFVARGTGREITSPSAGGDAVGVLWNDPGAAGRAATVVTGGRPNVYASAAIADGAEISTTAAGLAVTSTSGDVVLGYAMHAASGNGVLVQVELLDEAQFTKA